MYVYAEHEWPELEGFQTDRHNLPSIKKQEIWFKHILFMTEHDKGLGRAKKLCLALSKTHTHMHI